MVFLWRLGQPKSAVAAVYNATATTSETTTLVVGDGTNTVTVPSASYTSIADQVTAIQGAPATVTCSLLCMKIRQAMVLTLGIKLRVLLHQRQPLRARAARILLLILRLGSVSPRLSQAWPQNMTLLALYLKPPSKSF